MQQIDIIDYKIKRSAFVFLISVAALASISILFSLFCQPTDKLVLDGRIDINSATAASMTRLPGIGDKLAQKIVDYRYSQLAEGLKPFSCVEDLAKVNGIGDKKAKQISEYVKF